jgi:hypothetical protein
LEQTRLTDDVGVVPFFPAAHLVHAEHVTDAALFSAWYVLPVQGVHVVDSVANAFPARQKF